MKFRLTFIFVCSFLCIAPYLIYQRYIQSLTAPDPVPELFQATDRIMPVTFDTTQDMAEAFQTAKEAIYIRSFPADFDKQGTPDLFAKTLLPYIQWYNRQLLAERQQLIAMANKLWAHMPLTQAESDRFMQLANLYGVAGEIDAGTAFRLLEKINVIPPTVALAVALKETENGKRYLDAPFGIFVWDADNRYVRAAYPNLEQAYYAWLYQLNTADAHAAFREMRQQWVSPKPYVGYFLLEFLGSLRPYDGQYTSALEDTYKKNELTHFEAKDESAP